MIGEIQRDVNHLIEAARELKIDKYILDIQNALKTAMREGILRPVPSRIVFLTLYSQLTFPFLMKNLVTTLLLEDKEQFSVFIRNGNATSCRKWPVCCVRKTKTATYSSDDADGNGSIRPARQTAEMQTDDSSPVFLRTGGPRVRSLR